MEGTRRFLGFGFGPIQAGLFLFEAQRGGSFGRYAVAEIEPELVGLIRRNGGRFTVNVAGRDGVTAHACGPIEILDPRDPADRELLVERMAACDEAATALPSVECYSGGAGSIAWTIARGLERRTKPEPAIIYAAENHNRAAEILAERVALEGGGAPSLAARAEFLNTVIGKMSGTVRGSDPGALAALGLAPIAPGSARAFLVEEFNRILVTKPRRARRALDVFVEKEDLLPYEEAKLYGHNASHALLAALARELGIERMAETPRRDGLIPFVRAALVEESGAALCRKYRGLDELFTPAGFAAYADDLLDRMTRRSLDDAVERVARDPGRKLGYEDRFFGTVRLCRDYGAGGDRFAFGAACALAQFKPEAAGAADVELVLAQAWGREDRALAATMVEAWERFLRWRGEGHPDVNSFWRNLWRSK